jgi:hypothetical protein
MLPVFAVVDKNATTDQLPDQVDPGTNREVVELRRENGFDILRVDGGN